MARLKIILKKSTIGSTKKQKSAVRCLGLSKIGQSVVLEENPVIKGQMNRVKHLISVENREEGDIEKG